MTAEMTAKVVVWLVRWAMGDGRWAMGDGRWAMVDGRWSMVDGRWSMVDGRWSDSNSASLLAQRSALPLR